MIDKPAGRSLLSRFNHMLDKGLIGISIAVGAVLTINMMVAVFFRYVLSAPIFWADELSLYLFCWATFLGASLAVKRSDMAAVTFLLHRLPGRLRVVGSMFIQVSILFFAVVMGYYSAIWITSPSVMNLLSPALSMSMWKLYTIVPVSMLCIALFAIENIIRLLPGLKSGQEGGTSP